MTTIMEALNDAARLREVITAVSRGVIDESVPQPRYASVLSVDHANAKATLVFPSEGVAFTVPTTLLAPNAAGAIVRVGGAQGARYIDELVSGDVRVRSGVVMSSDLTVTGVATFGTTVSTSGAFVAQGSKMGYSTVYGTSYTGLHNSNSGNYMVMSDETNTLVSTNSPGGQVTLRAGINGAYKLDLNANGNHFLNGNLTLNSNSINGVIDVNCRTVSLSDSAWLYGNGPYYFASWGGGWYMSDTTWIRTLNDKYVWAGNGWLGTNGGVTVGFNGAISGTYQLQVGGAALIGSQLTCAKNAGLNYGAATVFVDAGNFGGSRATVGLHPGSVAGSIGMLSSGGNVFNVWDNPGTGFNAVFGGAYTNASSRRFKQDIAPWPPLTRSLGAAVQEVSALDKLRQLSVVSFRIKQQQAMRMTQPTERRRRALDRLRSFQSARGLEEYPDRVHVCGDGLDCGGTADEPCSWTKNWLQPELGLVAEDVDPIVPEVVSYEAGTGAPIGINILAITALVAAAVQELDARVTQLTGT